MELTRQLFLGAGFLFTSFLTFYLPGFLLLQKSKYKLDYLQLIVLSTSIGLTLFTIVAIILGFLHLRFLSWGVFLFADAAALFFYKLKPFSVFRGFSKDKFLLILIFLAILIQGFINFPSGFSYKDGLYYWSSQGHDGLWHVAVMEEIKKEFPPKSPIFSGETLYNYHYLVDIVMGETERLFPFYTANDLYFRFFPLLFSSLITTSVFSFISFWKKNKGVAYWAVFFTTFAGSFGWVVRVFHGGNPLGGETVFWASQINTIIGNPPHAIAIGLSLSFLLALGIYLESKEKIWFVASFFLAFLMAGFKVSAGMILLLGLGAATFFDFLIKRKKEMLLLTGAVGITNVITIKLVTSNAASSFLVFAPWWFIRTLIVSDGRLNWMDLELRREYYLSLHSIRGYLRVAEYELIAFFMFLVGNLGMRFIGLPQFFKDFFKNTRTLFDDRLGAVIGFCALFAFLTPMVFIQQGVAYNAIQFFQYFILFMGFFAASTTYAILKKLSSKPLKILLVCLIIGLAIPTVIGNLVEFYGPNTAPNAKVSYGELQALMYLKDHTSSDSIILEAPYQKYSTQYYTSHPQPIYAWYSTAYIPAFSARTTFFSDDEQLTITGYPKDERLKNLEKFFQQDDPTWDKQFLKENSINYIYMPKIEMQEFLVRDNQYKEVKKTELLNEVANNIKIYYENSEVVIYEVQ